MTFDDGHRSCLRAAGLLKDQGATGTFFLTRDFCKNNPAFLDEAAVRELAELAEVGTHGTTHTRMTQLSAADVRNELVESKHWLEDVTGKPINFMSAPGGYWSNRLQKLSIELGYTLVGNSREQWNAPASIERSRLVSRVAIRDSYSMKQFGAIMRPDRTFYLVRILRSMLLSIPNALLDDAQARSMVGFRRKCMDWLLSSPDRAVRGSSPHIVPSGRLARESFAAKREASQSSSVDGSSLRGD
jgi:hypothetical protein